MTGGSRAQAVRTLRTIDACVECGYSLAGLPDDGACPECGVPVARTRERSDLLRGADSVWLRRVNRGLRDLELAMKLLLGCVAAIVLFLLALVIAGQGLVGGPPPRVIETVSTVVTVALAGAGALFHLRGCVLLSLGTAGGDAAPQRTRLVLLVCGALVVLLGMGAFVFRQDLAILSGWSHIAIRTLAEINALAFFFALAGVLRHYEMRTVDGGPEVRSWHNGLRRNLYILIAAIALQDWVLQLPLLAGGTGGIPMVLLAVAYVSFLAPVMRVRGAVAMELLIGSETGGREVLVPRPPRRVDELIPREQFRGLGQNAPAGDL